MELLALPTLEILVVAQVPPLPSMNQWIQLNSPQEWKTINVLLVNPDHVSLLGLAPEDHEPQGCSLLSLEPLQEWFCKGADVTSPTEYEAALCQLEDYPPDIRQYSDNMRKERWTHFLLEGVKFPTATVDVIQTEEALAIFERDLIIHFQHTSKAAALYVRALIGGVNEL